MKNFQKGHYAWDCIGESNEKRLLSQEEKEAVCRKISASISVLPPGVTAAVKASPFIIAVLFIAGIKFITESAGVLGIVCGVIMYIFSIFYIIFAVYFYFIKEMWVYDKWKSLKKIIMKKDVYRVPVVIGDVFQTNGKHKYYYANLRYTQDENFLDTYRITGYLYNNIDNVKLYCLYYEGKPGKDVPGKYKLFFIDEDKT